MSWNRGDEMERIKNFFYNKNDIIVALLIIIAAAVIIYFCMKSILDYPEKMLGDTSSVIDNLVAIANQKGE